MVTIPRIQVFIGGLWPVGILVIVRHFKQVKSQFLDVVFSQFRVVDLVV